MDTSKEFVRYLAHLAEGLGQADGHAGLSDYCTGLMLPLSRKSVEPTDTLPPRNRVGGFLVNCPTLSENLA